MKENNSWKLPKTKQNKSSSGLLLGKEIMQNLLSSRVI